MPAPIFDEDPPVVARPRMTARHARDLIGLALVILGVAGVVTAAWMWRPLAGFAAASAACIAVGFALAYDW